MTNNKKLSTFIAKFYTYRLLSLMGFIIPFIAVMLDKNGLNAMQIAMCLIAYQAVQFITEIPSGVIADKYSRRNVLIASQIFAGLAYTSWLFMPHFWGYFLGYACWGLWGSLASGCREAFLYDKLKTYDKRNLYERILGRSNAMASVGVLTASFVASYLVKIGFNFADLTIGAIITTLLSILILLTIKPADKIKESEEPENVLSYMQILKKGLKYSYKHTTVFKLILFLAFSSFINVGFEEYSEIFYNELTNDLVKVALIFGLMEIAYIIGDLSGEFLRKIPTRFLIFFYFLTACFDIIAFTLYKYPLSIAIVMFNSMIVEATHVNMSAKINDFIPSRTRATILSVKGFIKSLGKLITLFFFGKITDHFQSYRIGFLTFAYLFTIGSFVFLVILWRDKHLRKREGRLR